MKSKANPDKQLDQYTSRLKDETIEKMAEMGFDTFQVQDLIEEKGICENSIELCTQIINMPEYMNPLKVNYMQPPQGMAPMQQQYYSPRMGGQGGQQVAMGMPV